MKLLRNPRMLKAISKSKQKGWNECSKALKFDLEYQLNKQSFEQDKRVESLYKEIARLQKENKELRQEYGSFLELKTALLGESEIMQEAVSYIQPEISRIFQKFMTIVDRCNDIDRVHRKKEKKIKRMVG